MTQETLQQKIERKQREMGKLWQRIIRHPDPYSADFEQLREKYQQLKLEVRYLKIECDVR